MPNESKDELRKALEALFENKMAQKREQSEENQKYLQETLDWLDEKKRELKAQLNKAKQKPNE